MANTLYLKRVVEDVVRQHLAQQFGVPFESRELTLVTGGTHEFDAVSEDGRVVASIKSTSGKTSGGKLPSGEIRAAQAEPILSDSGRRSGPFAGSDQRGVLRHHGKTAARQAGAGYLSRVGPPPHGRAEARRRNPGARQSGSATCSPARDTFLTGLRHAGVRAESSQHATDLRCPPGCRRSTWM